MSPVFPKYRVPFRRGSERKHNTEKAAPGGFLLCFFTLQRAVSGTLTSCTETLNRDAAFWFLCNEVKPVPMLEALHAGTIFFMHMEKLQLQAFKKRPGLRFSVEIHECPPRPAIPVAEQISRKNSPGFQRRQNIRPQSGEMLRMTKRQGHTGKHE